MRCIPEAKGQAAPSESEAKEDQASSPLFEECGEVRDSVLFLRILQDISFIYCYTDTAFQRVYLRLMDRPVIRVILYLFIYLSWTLVL